MDSTVKIDGVEIPVAYKGLTVGFQDVDLESGRMANGLMKRNRVAQKRTVDITTPPLGPDDVSKVLKAVKPASFKVEFYDPEQGKRASGTFYSGDRSAVTYSDALGLYDSMTLNLVEY